MKKKAHEKLYNIYVSYFPKKMLIKCPYDSCNTSDFKGVELFSNWLFISQCSIVHVNLWHWQYQGWERSKVHFLTKSHISSQNCSQNSTFTLKLPCPLILSALLALMASWKGSFIISFQKTVRLKQGCCMCRSHAVTHEALKSLTGPGETCYSIFLLH